MNEIIIAAIIIFGIMQVILFFRILSMSDDISAIRKKYLRGSAPNKKEGA